MTAAVVPSAGWPRGKALALVVALGAGCCTMAYEVLWFRILVYFVDTSIQSFAILLVTFLTGLGLGGLVLPRFADSRREPWLVLGVLEMSIGLLALVSIPLLSQMAALVEVVEGTLGHEWRAVLLARFVAFSAVLLLPTLLMGGAFPVVAKIYAALSVRDDTGDRGRAFGEAYAVNTAGGVAGSLAAGLLVLPVLGVQSSLIATALVSTALGAACVLRGPDQPGRLGRALVVGFAAVALIAIVALPRDVLGSVHQGKYAPPDYETLLLREGPSGTIGVFRDTRRDARKFLVIDGRGEVSTNLFSMRAFRYLALLPALHVPDPESALVVTFGSGIVAGSIASLPGVQRVDSVEICGEVLEAAQHFREENHDVLSRPNVHVVVDDGRAFAQATRRQYDILSADATHPSSSDSWTLYTREFYSVCRDRLTDRGVMSQWIPLHGIVERDYRTIVDTFRSVFPHVAVYFTGGHKTIGHTVLVGSKQPLRVDVPWAERLLRDPVVRSDLERVDVASLEDFLAAFLTDEQGLGPLAPGTPLNTDDRPRVLFSRAELIEKPYMGLGPIVGYRKSVVSHLVIPDGPRGDALRARVQQRYEATGHTLAGQLLEFDEHMARASVDPDGPAEVVAAKLAESRGMLARAIGEYRRALALAPSDRQTQRLLRSALTEHASLTAALRGGQP